MLAGASSCLGCFSIARLDSVRAKGSFWFGYAGPGLRAMHLMLILRGHHMLLQEAHQLPLLCSIECAVLENSCLGGRHLPILPIPPYIAA